VVYAEGHPPMMEERRNTDEDWAFSLWMGAWAQTSTDAIADPVPRTISEATLQAASRGDRAAWQELVGLYASRTFALAKSRVGNVHDAEDITQSVFVTVAKHLRERLYEEQGRFEPWLFTIVMNRVRDFARKRTRERQGEDELRLRAHVEPGVSTASSEGTGTWDVDQMRRAVAKLDEADREIVELRHHAEMSFKQISEMLDEPMGTLLARHHRALRKLKTLLTSEDRGG
jgi:RNA polymerase sigma-70 factor, ECF subfamily